MGNEKKFPRNFHSIINELFNKQKDILYMTGKKITKENLKSIIFEEFNAMLEQGEVPAGMPDALKGPTYVGQAIPQKPNPTDALQGQTYVAPAAAPQQNGGTVPANTLVNIKKQLAVLTAEIDKVLGGLANAAGAAKPKKK